jgi:hypothetical protein
MPALRQRPIVFTEAPKRAATCAVVRRFGRDAGGPARSADGRNEDSILLQHGAAVLLWSVIGRDPDCADPASGVQFTGRGPRQRTHEIQQRLMPRR